MEKPFSEYPPSSAYLEADHGMPESLRNYIEQLRQRIGTPDMASEWGCTTTAAAFAHNLLLPTTVTPAELDQIVDREPGKPGNVQAINLWLLDQGLQLETYETEFTSQCVAPYIRGDISYQQYFKEYENRFGPKSAKDRRELKRYMEDFAKPAYHAAKAEAQPYFDNGQLSTREGHPSPELLVDLINQGKLVRVSQYSDTAASSHELIVFRPHIDYPGIYFDPSLPPGVGDTDGSDIFVLSTYTLDTIKFDSAFTAISQR